MAKFVYKDEFPPGTFFKNGKPWTPNMVRTYRGLSEHEFRKLSALYSYEDILLKDSVTANNTGTRSFVDNSAVLKYGGVEWTLAMIYRYLMPSLERFERPEYRLFAQRVRNHMDSNGIKLRDAVDAVAEAMGLASPSVRLPNVSNEYYERIKSDYIAFINDHRPKAEYREPPDVNLKWYENARLDPNIYWYLFQQFDEQIAKLQADNARLAEQLDNTIFNYEREKDENGKLQRTILKLRRANEPSIVTELS